MKRTLLALFVVLPGFAHAGTLTWTLSSDTLLQGTFDYDTSAVLFSNVALTNGLGDDTYSALDGDEFAFLGLSDAFLDLVVVELDAPMTDAGGTIAFLAVEFLGFGDGEVVSYGTISATSVPEPKVLSLLTAGMIVLWGLRRRRPARH